MLKINYGNEEDIKKLKSDYLGIFSDLAHMRRRWKSILVEIGNVDTNFEQMLPRKLDDLLVMDYIDLVPIYEGYISLKISPNLTKKMMALFSYDRVKYRGRNYAAHQPKIAKFFMERADLLDIYTCKYCDTAYINVYRSKGLKNHFDLDHMLDKGKCPLVGLCLFNFVPSCQVCNEKLKKSWLPGSGEVLKKLSPTSPLYKFEDKVKIVVENIKGSCSTFDFENRMDDFKIKFDCHKDVDYEKEINLLKLKERYNFHKAEALRLMDLQERYSEAHIVEVAKLISGSNQDKDLSTEAIAAIVKIQADMFSNGFHKRHHRIFGKLYNDITK